MGTWPLSSSTARRPCATWPLAARSTTRASRGSSRASFRRARHARGLCRAGPRAGETERRADQQAQRQSDRTQQAGLAQNRMSIPLGKRIRTPASPHRRHNGHQARIGPTPSQTAPSPVSEREAPMKPHTRLVVVSLLIAVAGISPIRSLRAVRRPDRRCPGDHAA